MGGFAWVTLATNDSYSLGALVLAHSLRCVGTKYDLAVLVTPGVTGAMREKLASVFSLVQEVNVLDSKDEANLALLARPELGITFTKLHCWRLTQYEKCVFVDADTLVVRNCDELFEREELSAAPDVGWPDCFNSGVFVFKPSQQTFASITAFAAAKGSFDGGDQGLLNQYFSDWSHKDISKHLPFIYNMCSTATYSYLPAFKQFGDDVRIIHFIGITKPWLQYFDTLTGQVQPAPGSNHLQPLLQLWWNIFCEQVHPQLSPVMAGIAGALAKITLGEARSPEQVAFEEHMRKLSWEQGQIDYMGRDSFDNIWKKISETLATQPKRQPSPPKTVTKPDKTEIEIETPVTTEDEPAAKSEAAVLPEFRQKEEQDLISELAPTVAKIIPPCAKVTSGEKSAETVPPQSSSSDAAVALAPTVPQLPPMESVKSPSQKNDNETSILTAATTRTDSSIPQMCERLSQDVKLGEQPSKTDFHETPAAATIVLEREKTLESQEEIKVERLESTGSTEVVSDSPVPIQVAESVLEAEVKESVTEDLRPLTEEVISSISMSAQESVPAVLETAMEAVGPATPTPNGSAGLDTEIGNGIDALNLSCLPRVTSSLSAVAEIAPEVVASVRTQEVTPAGQSEEACPRPVRSVEAVPEAAPDVRKEETCLLPVGSVEAIPEAASPAQKEETCPLPVRPVKSVPEAKPSTQTQQSGLSVGEPMEKPQEVKLPVEQAEKSQEVKLLAEVAQASLSSVKPLEKTQEVKNPVATTQPTALPVETVEKLHEATVVEKGERTRQSSVVPAEKPVESKLPTEAEEPGLPTAERKPPTKPEPIVCPMKPERKASESELPIKTEEPSSLPVAARVVESKPDIASPTEESIEKKVPKDEAKDAEVASEETASQSESSEESPVRPARTKDIQIPGTPIVTEATPPTSPPIGAVESFEDQPTKVTKKVVKKVVKKSTSAETKSAEGAEAEAEVKKVTKKVVKKVVKKTKEDDPSVAESSSGNDKPKKTVKVVKKTTKAPQSLESDTTVPETPPPGTSEMPVPPKRKLKTTAKTTSAKCDSEP